MYIVDTFCLFLCVSSQSLGKVGIHYSIYFTHTKIRSIHRSTSSSIFMYTQCMHTLAEYSSCS